MRRSTFHAWLVGAALTGLLTWASAQMKQSEEETSGLRYLMALPANHATDSPGKWPVLVFLHGSGESGNDLSSLMVHSIPAVVESDYWDWPFIVVSPQSEGGGWGNSSAALTAILTRLETEFHADPNRYYLTGLSMGGEGTWSLGEQMDGTWAALMPLCADGDDNFMPAPFVDTPLFVIHGDADNDNDYSGSRDRVDALIAAGVTFFEFDYPMSDQLTDNFPVAAVDASHVFGTMNGYGHDVWTATYGVRDQEPKRTVPYNWLLKQSLDGSPFTDPLNPVQPPEGGAGGAAGAGGASGAAGAAAGGSAGAGGAAAGSAGAGGTPSAGGVPAAGSAGQPTATAGTPAAPAGGSSGGAVSAPMSNADTAGGGCAVSRSAAEPWHLLVLGVLWLRRRRNRLGLPSLS
jgi:predicted esterase